MELQDRCPASKFEESEMRLCKETFKKKVKTMNSSNPVRLLVGALGLVTVAVIFVQWRPSFSNSNPSAPVAVAEVEHVRQPVVSSKAGEKTQEISRSVGALKTESKLRAQAAPSTGVVQERKWEDLKSGEYAVNLAEDDTELAYQVGQDLASMPADELARLKEMRAAHAQEVADGAAQ